MVVLRAPWTAQVANYEIEATMTRPAGLLIAYPN
jgi:hypothetical protein